MAIIGSLIKGAIEIKSALTSETPHAEAQHNILTYLLETAKDTAFGKTYNFESILAAANTAESFAQTVPFFDYHKMEREWWSKTVKGQENISWPGLVDYFALSSGTTGKKSKRIPVTDEMIDTIRGTGIKQIEALSNFDLPAEFFEKSIMMLGSSTNLEQKDAHYEGEISGISAANIPSWFDGYYKPGRDIAQIDDWDERVERIAKNAKNWDIGALSGIPSWMELMMKRVIEYHNVATIHDVWPNLQVYTSGGVAFEPYAKSFNKLLSHPITVIDTYLASEGFLAFQSRPETDAMQLVTDNGIYFEFVPFKADYIKPEGSLVENAPVLSIGEVEEGEDYVLLISTVSGTWRYIIGDTIQFTNKSKAEIIITGRTKFFMNVVGSQLSVNKMNTALRELEQELDVEIPEFTLSAVREDKDFIHHWYLGCDNETIDDKQLADLLDQKLKEANKNYKVARSKALKGVKVTKVPTLLFSEWSGEQKKKGGQIKMERVMSEEKFSDWKTFAQNYLTES